MEARIQELVKRSDDILRGKRRTIRKGHAAPQREAHSPAAVGDLPGHGQFGFGLLGEAVDADQDAFGQIADSFRRLVSDHQRIERLGLAVQGEVQLGGGKLSDRQEQDRAEHANHTE